MLKLSVFKLLLLGFLLGITTKLSYAQQDQVTEARSETTPALEEIVVTGEKRERKLLDVPSSISVVSKQDVELLAGRSLVDAASLAPNIVVQNQGGRTGSYFYTRGIGRSELNFPIVAVNVNGVALPDPSFFGLDIDAAQQIEFLRGPQGTLYGQNTLGGVINIVLQKPSDEFAGSADFVIGERGFRESALRLEGPVASDKLKAAATVLWSEVDGFIKNTNTQQPQNSEKNLGASLYVTAAPSDDLDIEFSYFTQDRKDGLAQYPKTADLFSISNDAPTEEEARSHIAGLKISYDLPYGRFESQTGFSKIDRFTQNDLDFSSLPLATATADSDIDQLTQELRFVSENDGALNYIVGIYALQLENNFDVYINDFVNLFKIGLPSRINDLVKFEDQAYAAFGQANYIIGNWELVAGLRYQHEKISTDNTNTIVALPINPAVPPLSPPTNINGEQSYDELLPRLAANYSFSNSFKLYASIAKGFRAGGFNPTALTAERVGIKNIPTSYGPEFTWNYELGAKWRLPEGKGRIDFAAFYIDWSDLQAEQIAPGSLIDFRTNSASATSVGVELEARLFPSENWEVGVSFGYSDAEYDQFIELISGSNYQGNQVAGGAKTTWSLFARYDNPNQFNNIGLTAHLSANGAGKRFFDIANKLPGESYSLVNARVGLNYKSWELFAFARNLFDEQYIEYEFPAFGSFVNEPKLVGAGIEFSF